MQSNIISRSIKNVISRFRVNGTQMLRAFDDAGLRLWHLDLCTGPFSARHCRTQISFWNVSTISQGTIGIYLPVTSKPAPNQTSEPVLRHLFQRPS